MTDSEKLLNIQQSKGKTRYLVWSKSKNLHWRTVYPKSKVQHYEKRKVKGKGSLAAKYIVPPMDIIRLNSKEILDRRKQWQDHLGFFDTIKRRNIDKKFGKILKRPIAVSEYSPVLMELICTWFCAPGRRILDPFAGGPYKGAVASLLGCCYTGIELRSEQALYNQQCAKDAHLQNVEWLLGDSMNCDQMLPATLRFDLLFCCPPYGSVEHYSTLPEDLSNQATVEEFWMLFCSIMKKAIAFLQEDAFVVLQVADFRLKSTGDIFPFEARTITFLSELDLRFHNGMTIMRRYGDAMMRCEKAFTTSRKCTKVTERLLVFYKGDYKKLLNLPEFNVFITPLQQGTVKEVIRQAKELGNGLGPSSDITTLPVNLPNYESTNSSPSPTKATKESDLIPEALWATWSKRKRKNYHNRDKKRMKKIKSETEVQSLVQNTGET